MADRLEERPDGLRLVVGHPDGVTIVAGGRCDYIRSLGWRAVGGGG
jgi:hypothetical protein